MSNVWPSIASIMSTKIELIGPPVNIKFLLLAPIYMKIYDAWGIQIITHI